MAKFTRSELFQSKKQQVPCAGPLGSPLTGADSRAIGNDSRLQLVLLNLVLASCPVAQKWQFPEIRGTLFWSPYKNQDPTI